MEGNLSKYALIFLVLALSGVIFFLQNIHTLEVSNVTVTHKTELVTFVMWCHITQRGLTHNSKVLTKCVWIIDCCFSDSCLSLSLSLLSVSCVSLLSDSCLSSLTPVCLSLSL